MKELWKKLKMDDRRIQYGTIGLAVLLLLWITVPIFMGRAIKLGIQTLGPKITQTEMEVGMVTISPFSGKARIRGLEIGNPKGFKTDRAMALGDFRVKVDLKSLASDVVVIPQIVIDKPEISYESNSQGNNLKLIQRNVDQFTRKLVGSNKDEKEQEKKEIKFYIHDLVVRNATLYYSPRLAGSKVMKLTLPEIHLKEIGKPNGVPPSAAVSSVMKSLTSSAGAAVGKVAKDIGKGVGKSVNKAAEGIRGLFGK